MVQTEDKQISLTDPYARSMATGGQKGKLSQVASRDLSKKLD
jgi:hypothetical protein